MATATIIRVWKDNNNAYLAATVNEGGAAGVVEYQANTPLLDSQGQAKSNAQLKADLTTAVTTVRNALTNPLNAIPISGTITV